MEGGVGGGREEQKGEGERERERVKREKIYTQAQKQIYENVK